MVCGQQGFGGQQSLMRQPFHASQAQSFYDSQMTTASPPRSLSQRQGESYYDSQMTTDSSGAYDSQSQPYSVSNTFGESGSQGESQERRSSFLNSNGKRGFSVARPPSGPATVGHISKESSSVSAYLNSVTKSGQHARAPSPVFGKMRPTAMIGSNKGASTTLPSPHGVPQGDLDSVVSALRDRPSAGAGYEQLRLELKEHISQEFKKIESSLQSHNLKVEECRQDVASAHAEVIKLHDTLIAQFQDAKTGIHSMEDRLASSISESCSSLAKHMEDDSAQAENGRSVARAHHFEPELPSNDFQGNENEVLGQAKEDNDIEELDLFADPFAKKLEEQAAKRQAKLTRRFQGRKAPKT